jgi:hydrogenase expression/formation protein HypD
MKYLDEYRDSAVASGLTKEIAKTATRPWVLMEVCGGQTHSIVRYGIDRMIPECIELVHGPGCPVCVTSLEMIDKAHAIASHSDVIFTSFGDMLRVPGSRGDLLTLKSRGADVRVVYSPLDAVQIARDNPEKRVVFFGVGFETTAPANAMAVYRARLEGVKNFSMLVSHVLVPPAMAAVLQAPDNRVQGFLGPGHVCAVVGYREYESLCERFHVPIVVTGFEPIDLLEGILMTVRQLEAGRAQVENQYVRAVAPDGNRPAIDLISKVFEVADRKWRGVGPIPDSGYQLRAEYRDHDAEKIFEVESIATRESETCISGLILRGARKPSDCPAFGKECTPQRPLGATMVSAEGACAAYYQYGRYLDSRTLAGGSSVSKTIVKEDGTETAAKAHP